MVGAESLGRVGAGAGVHPHEMVVTAIKETTSFDRADARMKCFLPQILVDAHAQCAVHLRAGSRDHCTLPTMPYARDA